jgi:cobalt-zinc-cadmium efflux system membrane fusion protein
MKRRLSEPALLRPSLVTLAFLACLGGLWLMRTSPAQASAAVAPAASAASAAASVQLSDTQWASLDIQAAAPAAFSTAAIADAVVAVDDRVTVPVFSPATGSVIAVVAELGQSVRRGQALAEIAGVETAQAASDLAAATAQARTAERQLALSREVATRQQALVDAGGGAAKDWHQSQSDLIAAEGAKRIADAALLAARTKAVSVGVDVSGGQGASGPARLVAPIAGQVIQRQIAAGQFVSSLAAGGAVPLFTISDLRRVWVVGSLGEREGASLRVGQAVEVTTLAAPGRPLRSVITWVAPVVDPLTRRVQFRAELANTDLSLRPQMTARMRVLDSHAAPVIAIPGSAIIRDGDEAHCYVATAQHTLTLRVLKLGRVEGNLTEVLSGLKPGERVVTRGAIFVDTLAQGGAS